MDRVIETIPTETMNALIRWNWSGNVRELENFIERSVILTEGTALRAPLAELKAESPGWNPRWKTQSGNTSYGFCARAGE